MNRNTAILTLCISSAFVGNAYAQSTPLGTAVNNAPNKTTLQVGTGDTLNQTCGELVPKYIDDTDFREPPTSAEEALFINCSEMVGNALLLNGDQGIGTSLGWNNAQLAEGMQQTTGEEQVSKSRLATESSNGQYGNIGMRLDAIRNGARSTAGGLNLAMGGVPVVGGNAGEESEDGIGWGWFLNGALGTGDRDSTGREDKYDYDAYGVTLGFDYQFESGLVAGFALGYTDYQVDFSNTQSFVSGTQLTNTQAGGGFDSDGYSFSGYAIYNIGRFYVDGIASYTTADYTTERIVKYTGSDSGTGSGQGAIVDRSMKGDTDSETVALGASTGTTFDLGGIVDLSLSLGVSYLDGTVDSYTEKDRARGQDTDEFSGWNLAYDDQDFDSLQSVVGFQFSKAFSYSGGVLAPYFNADWRHEFENDSSTLKARYAAQESGQVFNLAIASDDPDEDYYELGVGVTALFANDIQAFVDYRTTVDLDHVSADLFTIGIRGAF